MKKLHRATFAHLVLLHNIDSVSCCSLHGTDSGICTKTYLPETYGGGIEGIEIADKQWKMGTDGPCKDGEAEHCMPFCGKWIASYYSPCIPAPMSLPKDQDFTNGRHTKHTVREKDRWVENTVKSIIDSRIAVETNATARKLGVDEYETRGKTTAIHFYNNKECQLGYERYFCWLNFPRCDSFEESLPMCQSACENLFRVCNFDPGLYPCSIDKRGETSESFFPGEPFKSNEYMPDDKSEPKAVCTPSIKGSAMHSARDGWNSVTYTLIACLVIGVHFF